MHGCQSYVSVEAASHAYSPVLPTPSCAGGWDVCVPASVSTWAAQCRGEAEPADAGNDNPRTNVVRWKCPLLYSKRTVTRPRGTTMPDAFAMADEGVARSALEAAIGMGPKAVLSLGSVVLDARQRASAANFARQEKYQSMRPLYDELSHLP